MLDHELRRTGIGGSDVAKILGLSTWGTASKVYFEKIGALAPSSGEDKRQRLGNVYQRGIIDYYCEEIDARIVAYEPGLVRHPDIPFLLANLDAIVAEGDEGPVTGFSDAWNVDAKNVHWRNKDQWGEEGSDQLPDDAFYQGHHYNFVTRRHRTDFAVAIGGDVPRIMTVPADDEFYALVIPKLEEFWWHVQNLVEIPPDFNHATTADLMKKLFPHVDVERTVQLPAKYAAEVELYYSLGQVESAAKKMRAQMQPAFLFAMGDAGSATIEGSSIKLKRIPTAPRSCSFCGRSKKEEGGVMFKPQYEKGHVHPLKLKTVAQRLIEGEK